MQKIQTLKFWFWFKNIILTSKCSIQHWFKMRSWFRPNTLEFRKCKINFDVSIFIFLADTDPQDDCNRQTVRRLLTILTLSFKFCLMYCVSFLVGNIHLLWLWEMGPAEEGRFHVRVPVPRRPRPPVTCREKQTDKRVHGRLRKKARDGQKDGWRTNKQTKKGGPTADIPGFHLSSLGDVQTVRPGGLQPCLIFLTPGSARSSITRPFASSFSLTGTL